MQTDVVIVGAGPAGLATAIELRRRQMEVHVVDSSRPPIDKACGEGIMPDGVRRLVELGVELPEEKVFRLRGIGYFDGDRSTTAEFPSESGLGVRRPVLHAALMKRCKELGVETSWGLRADSLLRGDSGSEGVVTGKGEIRARWVVGADGLNSRVRRWAGLSARGRSEPAASKRRFGVRRHFDIEPWTDFVEVYWGEGMEAYVTPVGARETGVAILWSGEGVGFDSLLERFRPLATRLQGRPSTSRDRGAGPLEQRCRGVASGNVGLVGDASGYRDPISGEGLSLAFHQAAALARAISQGSLHSYEKDHRGLIRLPFAMIKCLLFLEKHPRLRARWIETLESDPGLFARLLEVHCRSLPPSRFGLGPTCRLALGMVGIR